jgi:hypothetical protein
MRNSVTVFVVVILFGGMLVLALWVYDVRSDRNRKITVNGPTPVFVGNGDEACDRKPALVVASKSSSLQIRRIRYWKNCATIDVALSDGGMGYVVSGVGDFSISPPLP